MKLSRSSDGFMVISDERSDTLGYKIDRAMEKDLVLQLWATFTLLAVVWPLVVVVVYANRADHWIREVFR